MDDNRFCGFVVMDLLTGKKADLETLQEEDWVAESCTGKLINFCLTNEAKLYLMDENNNLVECDQERFQLKVQLYSDLRDGLFKNINSQKEFVYGENWSGIMDKLEDIKRVTERIQSLSKIDKMQHEYYRKNY